MKKIVDQIQTRLKEQGVGVPEGEVESRLRMLIEDFRVPESEARRSVLNYFLKEHGLTPIRGAARGASEKANVSGISEPGKWIDLEIKVLELWEPNSESISQTGLVGDETGSLKFVKWAKSGLSDLEEGKSYLLKNVTTDEYQGRFSIKINRTSEIMPLEEDIAVGTQAVEFTGAMVDVQKGSGLIKRCPVCKRSLAKGLCGEHGKVEGIYDLRIKGVLDDGTRVQDVLINREITESLIGLTLEEAKKMAMEALDHEVVRGLIEEKLMGRYYTALGPRVDRYVLVERIKPAPSLTSKDVDEVISAVEVA
jgi:replication factor A1